MIAYEFYRRDKVKGNELIGILPERRTNPGRIDQESIIKWVRMVLGDQADLSNIFFVKVTIAKTEVGKRKLGLKRNTAFGTKNRGFS